MVFEVGVSRSAGLQPWVLCPRRDFIVSTHAACSLESSLDCTSITKPSLHEWYDGAENPAVKSRCTPH